MFRVLEILGRRPVGGVGSFLINYQSHFSREDVQLDYLMFDDESTGKFDDTVKKMGSRVFVLPKLSISNYVKIIYSLYHFFSEHQHEYKTIHLHSANLGFFVFPIAKKFGIPNRLVHSHATVYSDKKLKAIRNRVLCKQLMHQANYYCACSILAGDFLYGKNNRKIVHVFNNAIETDRFCFDHDTREKVRSDLKITDNFVVGHVGRFDEQKNHAFLIDVFKETLSRIPEAKLLLVGDGPLKSEIKAYCEKIGVAERVEFLGYRKDVPELLQAMDVFVLPSLFEGLPVIGIEAQATGLPMIVSDTVTKELGIRDVTFLSLNDNKSQWVRAIYDIYMRKEIYRGDANKVLKEKGYEISNAALELESFYRELQNN